MKDLYAQLGVNADASAGEIAAAGMTSPEAGACALILANEEQREAYDRTHATLKSIGVLRHRLGLDSGDSWFLANYPDFAPRFRSAIATGKPAAAPGDPALAEQTRSESLQQTRVAEAVTVQAPAKSSWLVPIGVGAAIVILLIALVLLL